MRTIAVEEHFMSPGFMTGPGRSFVEQFGKGGSRGARIIEQLQDVGDRRIAEMDAAGIDVQVLSLNSPGLEQAEAVDAETVARESNDFLLHATMKHPGRLFGLAAIPTASPDAAVRELEHRICQQAFKGVIINGHQNGRYLDDPAFGPILECIESLAAPLYLHPTVPPKPVVDASYGGLAAPLTAMLSSAGWGWHIETAIHLLRMIVGGVFDRYPKLQVVIGHMGEGLPFMMPRIERNLSTALTKLQRPMASYFRENVHYTFGGFNFPSTFLNLSQEIGIDRILFSIDYPYGSMQEAREFLEQLPISIEEKEQIAFKNAERLFKL